QELLHALSPGLPAQGAIETREMESHRAPVSLGRGAPLSVLQHLGLVPLLDEAAAALAMKLRGLGLPLLPADVRPADPVQMSAEGAGNEEAPLVRGQELPLDPAQAFDRGRA